MRGWSWVPAFCCRSYADVYQMLKRGFSVKAQTCGGASRRLVEGGKRNGTKDSGQLNDGDSNLRLLSALFFPDVLF